MTGTAKALGRSDRSAPPADQRRLRGAVFLLGFALSGFFDGILLHQILQWHHLLSALEQDLRFQIMADGWFHVAMYVVAAIGLWQLWRARGTLGGGSAGMVAGWGLIGFGVWHMVDAIGSHWLLGIHRIRMASANPLAWDIAWLLVFGVVPLLIGLWLKGSGGPGRGARSVAVSLALLAAGAGFWALRPPPGPQLTTIVFGTGVSPTAAREAAYAQGRDVVWSQESDGVYVVSGLPAVEALALVSRGAIFLSGAGLPEGCFNWTVLEAQG